MKESAAERLLTEAPPPRAERRNLMPCQFLDADTLDVGELRALVGQLERQATFWRSLGETDPTEWAAQMQEFGAFDVRHFGQNPHAIVVLENVRQRAMRATRAAGHHLGFVVRSEYNPAAIYLDRR